MFHKVQKVTPLPNYTSLACFENGAKKKYFDEPLFKKWEVFTTLSSVNGLFQQVKVDIGGYGIMWNDEIDISCEELYENGMSI